MIGFATDGEQFDATYPNLAFTGMKPEKAA